jgi:hypothetical protein
MQLPANGRESTRMKAKDIERTPNNPAKAGAPGVSFSSEIRAY